MFYLSKEAELTVELLQKMINRFNCNVLPQLERYKNYYDGKQAILSKAYADKEKPCSRTVINYCKNIADAYNGYLAGMDSLTVAFYPGNLSAGYCFRALQDSEASSDGWYRTSVDA